MPCKAGIPEEMPPLNTVPTVTWAMRAQTFTLAPLYGECNSSPNFGVLHEISYVGVNRKAFGDRRCTSSIGEPMTPDALRLRCRSPSGGDI